MRGYEYLLPTGFTILLIGGVSWGGKYGTLNPVRRILIKNGAEYVRIRT